MSKNKSKNKNQHAVEMAVAPVTEVTTKETFVNSIDTNKGKQPSKADFAAMNVALAKEKMNNDELALQLEKTTEGYVKDTAKLQEEIMFLKLENQEKTTLLEEVKEMFQTFANEWNALKNKPFKRFTLAVSFATKVITKALEVINKINEVNEAFKK
jgi:hypothetical protein